MSVSIRPPRALLALAALAVPVWVAAETIPTPVRTFVQAFVGDAGQGAVRATAVPNLYEVRLGDQFIYVTGDAKFFLHGDLYETPRPTQPDGVLPKRGAPRHRGRHRSADVHRLRAVGSRSTR